MKKSKELKKKEKAKNTKYKNRNANIFLITSMGALLLIIGMIIVWLNK